MAGQNDAAAERSAHVERGPVKKPGADFLTEVRPGVWQLKAVAEAEREVERLREALRLIVGMTADGGEINRVARGALGEVLA